MSQNSAITQDDLQEDIRADNEDSINFFDEKEITILHKNISEPVDEATQKQIDGLESLIKGFGATPERIAFNKMLTGEESYNNDLPKKRSIIVKVIAEIINFLKRVVRWFLSLITNRIARAETRLAFLEQRRKVNGLQFGYVGYTGNIINLSNSILVSSSPSWVIMAGKQALSFYKRSIAAHKKMIEFINISPSSLNELKEQKIKVLSEIGRIMTNGNVSQAGFITDLLPGNRYFNVAVRTSNSEGTPFFFTESSGYAKLKINKWEPSAGLISNGFDLLRAFIDEIKKEQTTTVSLSRNFEQQIKGARKNANNWTTAYFNWLIEINRKFTSLTFQQTMRWYDALESFVSSGVR